MKILVINNDLMERTVIQQVLQHNGHEIIAAENSETAMQLLQEGELRFIIADRVTTDIDEKQFIQRVREAKAPYYIYILLIASKVQDTDITTPRAGADDYLHKPIVPLELKSRVHIGERILGLGDHLVQAKDTLESNAMFDDSAKVLNQKSFLALSYGELERARRAQSPLSLIALDVDNFQSISDHYGEAIGKDILTVIAHSIREKSRPYDEIGRFEDHLFLIMLPGIIGQEAEKIADRILKGILNTNISLQNGTAVNVSLNVGIVCSTRIGVSTEIEALIEHAQEAVSQAKRQGGNQVHVMFV